MAMNIAGFAWLGPWVQAKPSRAHQGSHEAWQAYILDGLKEQPDGYFTKISKRLSYMLRHGAAEEGLPLNKDGAVSVETLLRHQKFKHNSQDDIEIVVRTNPKQRFGMDIQDGKLVVYCRQGHSNRLGLDPLGVRGLVALSPADVPACAVHGTFNANLASIRSKGLMALERPIHLAVAGGFSGVRSDSDVRLHVAVRQAASDGIPFFMSENGVLLTNGRDGILPSQYIIGGMSLDGACLFGEIPDEHGKKNHRTEAIPIEECTPALQTVMVQPTAVMRRWGKAANQHTESASQAVSENTVASLDSFLPADFPVLQEAVQQDQISTTLSEIDAKPHTAKLAVQSEDDIGNQCQGHKSHDRSQAPNTSVVFGLLDSGANPCGHPVGPRNIELAKSVIKILRHKTHDKHLSLDADGFVTLQELLQLRRFANVSEEEIWNEANADKVRFDAKVVDGRHMIRATDKHSVTTATSSRRGRFQ